MDTEEGRKCCVIYPVVRDFLSSTVTFEQYIKETKKSIKLISRGKFSRQQ